jgi:prevent-host-death family protein
MDVGIREAKNRLSQLVAAAHGGETVFLTNRGERVAKLVPTVTRLSKKRGLGLWKGKVNLYPGWNSPEEDQKIAGMFLESIAKPTRR